MNKKISTRVGLLTGLLILVYILFLSKSKFANQSSMQFVPFMLLFIGILCSCALLYRYYAAIKPIEALTHCLKTLATILVIILFGNGLLYYLLQPKIASFSGLTFLLMKTIFAYSLSGVLSSLVSSFIFNTFTKK